MSTNRPKKGQQNDEKGQSGRRKLEFEHKPLHGKIFYFDLIKYKNSAKLQKDIISLGGKVEEFLSNSIHYVITNRPEGRELEKRSTVGSNSAESPSVSTPSPFQQGKGSSKDAADSPCALAAEKNNSSRGKAIASRALSSQQFGTVSILTQAIQWGVQVKHLDNVLKYIKREREKLGTSPVGQSKSRASTERVSSSSRGDGLSGSFIKVEDRHSHYRPISKSLEVWPRVSTDTAAGSCPYDGSAFKSRGQRQGQSDNNAGPSDTPVNKTAAKEKGLTLIEIRKRKAEKMKEKKKGFCECCKQRYDNLDKHLSSSEHRQFVTNQNHYSALDRMITEGPDIAAFLEDVIRYHDIQKQDALCSNQDIVDSSQPKTKLMKASPSVAITKNTEATNPSDLPGQSGTSRLQRENSLRVSLPLEHAQPKRLSSQRSPEVINEAEFDSSRVEEVYQEIWLGEPPLRSASEVDVNEFIKHRAAVQKRVANTSKRKPKTSSNSQKKQTVIVEKPINNSQETTVKTTPNRKLTPKSQGKDNKQMIKTALVSPKIPPKIPPKVSPKISPKVSPLIIIKRKSVKRSFDDEETECIDESKSKEDKPKENPRKRRKTVTYDAYEEPVFCDDIPKEVDKVVSPANCKQKQKKESCISKKLESQREQKSPSPHGQSPRRAGRARSCKDGNSKPACSNNNEPKTTKTVNTTGGKKQQNMKKKDAKGLLNRVLGKNQRGKRKKGCKILNRTFDATLSVEHVFSSDLGGSEFLGFQSEDIRESELNLQLRINESMGKAPLADAALEVTCVKCDRNDNASESQTSSQDLAIECVLHTVDNFSQDESDWERQIDGYMSKLDDDGVKPETETKPLKVENIKPVEGTNSSPKLISSSPVKGSRGTPNQVSRAFISEILERRQTGYQRTSVEDLFPDVRVRRRDVLFDSSAEDIENLPVPDHKSPMISEQNVPQQLKSPSKLDNKIRRKSPQKPLKKLRSLSLIEPRQAVSPVSPGLSVRNENIVMEDVDTVFLDSPTKHLLPGSKLRERSKSAEPRTPRTPCKTQRCMFSTPEQKDKVWLVKSPGCSASPPMLQLPPGTPQEEVEIIEENYVHDETEIEIVFPKFSSPMRIGSIKTPVKHIADPHTGRPVPSPVKSRPTSDTNLTSVISLDKALALSPIKMNVAVYVPDFAKEGFARNLFGSKKSGSSKAKRSSSATSNAVISPSKSFMLFYDKHSSTPTSATFRARTKVISPIFSAYKKPRFSLNLLKPPKMKYAKSGRRTRKQMKEEQEDLLRRLSLSQFVNKSSTELPSDELNEALDAIYDFEEDVSETSSTNTRKMKRVKTSSKKITRSEAKKKSTNKKKSKSPQRRRTRSNGKRSSICSLQEVPNHMMEELCQDGFFC